MVQKISAPQDEKSIAPKIFGVTWEKDRESEQEAVGMLMLSLPKEYLWSNVRVEYDTVSGFAYIEGVPMKVMVYRGTDISEA